MLVARPLPDGALLPSVMGQARRKLRTTGVVGVDLAPSQQVTEGGFIAVTGQPRHHLLPP